MKPYFNGTCDCCGKRSPTVVKEEYVDEKYNTTLSEFGLRNGLQFDYDEGDYVFGSFVYKEKFNEYWCSHCAHSIYDANSTFLDEDKEDEIE